MLISISFLTKTKILHIPLYAWLILLSFLLPIIILKEHAHIIIHDNLDSEFLYRHLLKTSNTTLDFSSDAEIEQVMNGIPRSSLPSGLSFISLLFSVFNSFNAYLINHIIVHLIAFFGMFLLLKTLHTKKQYEHIIIGTSLCFALLPFYTIYGMSVAGQPLLLFAFLNIKNRKATFYDYLIIALFPFYSFFVFVGPFIISTITLLFLINSVQEKRINKPFLTGIFLLVICYLLVEFNLINSMFISSNLLSHRTEFISLDTVLICFKTALNVFLFGDYVVQSLPAFFIITPVIISIFINKTNIIIKRNTIYILLFIFAASIFYGFWTWVGWSPLREKIPILNIFNLSRFHFLFPLLWYILFSFSLSFIIKKKYGKKITILLLSAQIVYVVANNYEHKNIVKNILNIKNDALTFRAFFSEDLFMQIKNKINRPLEDYRVVSIGIPPTVSQYNGFYTLDSYQNNYKLNYKHQFRTIIEKELTKNDEIRKYFDNWGSRCYIFADELGKQLTFTKTDSKKSVNNLELNTIALKNMGGEFIFSALEIKNYKAINLEFLNIYTNEASAWKIYLYKVN